MGSKKLSEKDTKFEGQGRVLLRVRFCFFRISCCCCLKDIVIRVNHEL